MSDQNPETDEGSPPDLRRENPLLRSVQRAVDKLENAKEYIERDLKEGRDDMKGVLDRLARIETKIADLPSKVWIGGLVAAGVGVLTGLITLIFKFVTGH